MITVYTERSCAKCAMTKRLLIEKSIEYTEKIIKDLPEDEQEKIFELAFSVGCFSLPILVGENNEVLSIGEL